MEVSVVYKDSAVNEFSPVNEIVRVSGDSAVHEVYVFNEVEDISSQADQSINSELGTVLEIKIQQKELTRKRKLSKKIAACIGSMLDEDKLGSDDEMTVMLTAMSRLGFSKKEIKKASCKNEEKTEETWGRKKNSLRKGKKFGSFGIIQAIPPQLHRAQPK